MRPSKTCGPARARGAADAAPRVTAGEEGAAAVAAAVDVAVEASDRQGLLRDITELFAKDKTNVIAVQSQTVKGTAWMTFTVEVAESGKLGKVLGTVSELSGVRSARRR